MPEFVEIDPAFLASIATDEERIPTIYFHGNPMTRRVFMQRLRWLHRLILRHARLDGTCLDFGAGGGVFLPTLANTFRRTVSVDLVTTEARRVAERYDLDDVEIVEADALRKELPGAPYDAIVAADVLEHFLELAPPVERLAELLRDDGLLFTSLPTENFVYTTLRWIQDVEKPADHYHTGHEVEAYLQERGFERVRRWFVPLYVRAFPLYLLSVWRKGPALRAG